MTKVDNDDTGKTKKFCAKRAIAALLVLWGLNYLGTENIWFPTFFFTDNVRDWGFVLAVGIVLCVITNKLKTNLCVLTIARALAFWLYFSNPPHLFGGDTIACFYSFPPLIILSVYAWGLDNGLGSAKDNFKKWRNGIKEAGLNYKHGLVAFVGIMALLYLSFHTFNEHPEYIGSTFDIINADIISVVAGALIFRCVYQGKSEATVHLARYMVLLGIFIEGAGIQIVPTIVYDNPWLNMIWNMFPISASSIFMTLAVLSCLAFSIDLKRWKGRA